MVKTRNLLSAFDLEVDEGPHLQFLLIQRPMN